MADIHVLEGRFRGNGTGSIRIVYHIPVPESYRNGTIANYPEDYNRESAVPDIELSELDDIKTGVVYEHVESFRMNVNTSQAVIVALIRERWHDIQTLAGKHVRERYKYYGSTLARS